jgi:hypothetical protein
LTRPATTAGSDVNMHPPGKRRKASGGLNHISKDPEPRRPGFGKPRRGDMDGNVYQQC